MRILHIAHYFLPHQGGEERYAYYLGQELIKAGHEVWVLTSSLPGCPSGETMDGIKVIRHRAVATILRNPITPGILLMPRHLPGFDLIHAQNEHSFVANAAVFLKRRLHLPLVITCSGRLVFGNPFADFVERLYSATLGKLTLNSADRVIALSLSEGRRLEKLGVKRKKVAVIPTGIDLHKWDRLSRADTSSFLNKYSLNNRRVILFTGGITERKGIIYLIQALPKIVARHPDAVCLFVGDGDYRGEAERLAEKLGQHDYVRFTGRVSDEDMALAYKSCNIYVLPSLAEGLPATILEAFAFSKLVVATDIDGTRDYFQDTALLVPPRNSEALASAIMKVLAEPETGLKMGEKGRHLVESNFTWQQHVADVLKLYEEVTRRGSKNAIKSRTD